MRGGSCRGGLVPSCQPSEEGFHRWRREAQRGSCRGARDHGRSQGRLPAATGDRFDKDGTRDTTRVKLGKKSPKSSCARELPSENETQKGPKMSALSERFWDLPHICSVLHLEDGEPSAIPDLGKLWWVRQVPIQPFYHPEVITL